ncbi:MAG TPA: hypothetical protein H9827_04600 [Candidatus Luteimonas excrementigallinarum]|nr:hypothetical protein [Candidatus Luteimonas excrementigallinarum]
MSNEPRSKGGWAQLAVAALVATLVLGLVLTAIWPGSFAYMGAAACPAGYPDAFVEEDIFHLPGEVRWSWSLVCMSAHGALYKPFGPLVWLLVLAHLWLLCLVAILVARAGNRKLLRSRQ